jgi:hypothetical protein
MRNAHFSPISSIDGGSGQRRAAARNASMSGSPDATGRFNAAPPLLTAIYAQMAAK